MTTKLDPANVSNFTQLGAQVPATATGVLTFTDADVGDVSALFAADSDAAAGGELDIVASFQVRACTPNGADGAFRVGINDGVSKSAFAACAIVGGARVIALVANGAASDPATYTQSVPCDWTVPVSLRLRRLADGGSELVELDPGAAPSPRLQLSKDAVAGRTRAGASAELGCFSPEGVATVDVTSFATEKVGVPVGGKVVFTRFRIRDTDSADKLVFRCDFTLGAGTNGIDPVTEAVVIKLSTAAGVFYDQTLNGFTVKGNAPKRRWILNDAERTRTGIEQLVIDEDPNNAGGVHLRDIKTDVGTQDFSNITAEITIGTGSLADKLTGTAQLQQKPNNSTKWRLTRE